MRSFARSTGFPWRLLMVLVLVCVAVGVLVSLRSPRPAPFIVFRQPFQMPVPLRDRLGRLIPKTAGWGWAWRVEETVFGRRKPVILNLEVVSLTDSFRPALTGLSLGPASSSLTNGLQVWLLGADQLKALRQHLKQTPGAETVSRPRMSTGDGMECGMFIGESVSLAGSPRQVGLALGCCPQLHRDFTDLMTRITFSELVTNQAVASSGSLPLISVQTNLDTALRLQIPKGSGIFLFDRGARGASRKATGVIIDPPQPVPGAAPAQHQGNT
ncbi:MAG: hypothetical protein NT154_29840 [Verrucomicrobia bacterium]|nr:hypothetical protein [Verrucomicrobiota bacterium]